MLLDRAKRVKKASERSEAVVAFTFLESSQDRNPKLPLKPSFSEVKMPRALASAIGQFFMKNSDFFPFLIILIILIILRPMKATASKAYRGHILTD